ncbi:1-acyl-sn-glycerol-3-phosphate acyltransferase [Lactobacillus sp. ESL0785]|uniref:lysophospholipid acyltransferase family protein n=1 Tax=Lactobacillus sp. ESL0785 TaxID=2983232 RepID=UPI0023F73D1C|nr:1-acyl-sn-glycerol-3-phosphate acyltransferase [Lactobacillus sp. ESL0785]WEV70944.1 1-acyl-sn-glycerol-3-phosphate acyltransferase [Lactobacillus sp. ESL0785]
MVNRKYYYQQTTDDIVASKQQNYQLPSNYAIFPTTRLKKIWAKVLRPLAWLISHIYTKFILKVHFVGREKLTANKKQGFFIYGNHTQTFGDVVMPLSILPAQDYYALAAPANWGIPILGKLVLPYFGLPVSHERNLFRQLITAVKQVITAKKVVVIYPEAHVWPYYTKIRPFPATSMHFPVTLNAASYAMTTTYHKPKFGHKPHVIVYLDGPFYPDTHLHKKQAQEKLHDQIVTAMNKRAATSNYNYCTYHKIN